MVDGIMSNPFSMSTIPLGQPEVAQETKDKIRAQSRQRYAMEREKLEELIKIRSNKTFSPVEKAIEKAQQAEKDLLPKQEQTAQVPRAEQEIHNKPSSNTQSSAETDNSDQSSSTEVNHVGIPITKKTTFTLDDFVLGERYDGIVKLKYNYGLFVIVRGID